jgi:PTS system fructose-specific IIA component
MQLKDVLDKNIICIDLDVNNKDEALHSLSQLLFDRHYIEDVAVFVKDIYERESEGITGIGHGIAIPHGKSSSAVKPGIAIATLKEPIKWETLDEGDVDTIFLFCVTNDKDFGRNHMLLLSKIAAKLADDELIEKIRKVTSEDEMISYLTGEKTI